MYAIFSHFTPETRRAGYEYFMSLPRHRGEPGWRKVDSRNNPPSVCPIGACLHILGAGDYDLLPCMVSQVARFIPNAAQEEYTDFINANDGKMVLDLEEAMGA